MQKFVEYKNVMMYEITVNIRTYYIEINMFQDKAKINSGNKYNDNFFGLYCICKRPYPDPEDEVGELGFTFATVWSPALTASLLAYLGLCSCSGGIGGCERFWIYPLW